jgi:hypothetical protein
MNNMNRNRRELNLTAVVISLIVGLGLSLTPSALAQNDQRNNFGEGASHLGQTQQMGDHSGDGGSAGTHPYTTDPTTSDPDKPGRLGIGTLGHPADVVDSLCAANPGSPLCPP